MLALRIFLLTLVARVIISYQCFSDSIGWGDGFCLPDSYNKIVVPRDEDTNIALVNFTAIFLKDVYQFNNEDDTIKVRLFVLLRWVDPRITFTEQINDCLLNTSDAADE